MTLTVEIIKNRGEYIAICPELEINCYGSNRNEASRRIKNVINFYVDSAQEMGIKLNKIENIVEEKINNGKVNIKNTAMFWN